MFTVVDSTVWFTVVDWMVCLLAAALAVCHLSVATGIYSFTKDRLISIELMRLKVGMEEEKFSDALTIIAEAKVFKPHFTQCVKIIACYIFAAAIWVWGRAIVATPEVVDERFDIILLGAGAMVTVTALAWLVYDTSLLARLHTGKVPQYSRSTGPVEMQRR